MIFIICLISMIGFFVWGYFSWYRSESCFATPIVLGGISLIAVVIMLVVILTANLGVNGYIAAMNERREMLVYQYDNQLYDNDNDIGKRDLVVDIQKWNEDLAYRKIVQDDLWIGIFYPNIYDQFDPINLNLKG